MSRAQKCCVVFVVALLWFAPFGALSTPAVAYELPTTAPISDPWRAPTNAYGPGNRGVDFATPTGSTITSTEAGTVSFVGTVAGTVYVVVQHLDGLRSTYGGLSAVLVRVGQHLAPGERIALAGPSLHFGIRDGETYLNPMSLMDANAQLVSLDAPNVAARAALSNAALRMALTPVTGGLDVPFRLSSARQDIAATSTPPDVQNHIPLAMALLALVLVAWLIKATLDRKMGTVKRLR